MRAVEFLQSVPWLIDWGDLIAAAVVIGIVVALSRKPPRGQR